MKNEYSIWIGGEGGEGIISIGEMVSSALIQNGFYVFSIRTYPAEIKGGLAVYRLRFGRDRVETVGNQADVVVCLNEEAVQICQPLVHYNSRIILEKQLQATAQFQVLERIEIPFHEMTKKAFGAVFYKSAIVTGFLAKYLQLPYELSEKVLIEKFSKKRNDLTLIEKNQSAFQMGWNLVSQEHHLLELEPETKTKKFYLLSGNQAMALGALAAKCEFVAGYPITPATPILEMLAKELPKQDGVFIQTEDEMSALASCLGASFAGKRALTATSGPGFALMSELINLSVMAEIPIVLINVQRAGPSTGMPTKTEQSDLFFALYGSPGESPRVVLAPANVKEAFLFTQVAFDIADLVQGPVILLSDQSLGYRLETVEANEMEIVQPYLPATFYRKSIPALSQQTILVTGLEHNDDGQPDYSPQNHQHKVRYREKKFNRIIDHPFWTMGVEERGVEGGIGLVGWGSTFGVIRKAREILSDILGQSIGQFHFRWLNPFPKDQFIRWSENLSHIFFVEENFSGQLRKLVHSYVSLESDLIHKITGLPFTEFEIVHEILNFPEIKIGKHPTARIQS
ncbi:MAG: 2-oxoacid:acceptor oxidoreductase subunit alpha [bacterium]|nr:2-oxoacid:acceptor oxidoreductase subunit alpha [bacterium]